VALMPETRDEMEAAAVAWLVRLREGGAEDWEAFVQWLEADPRHSEIYDELTLADDAAGGLPERAPEREEEQAPGVGRRTFLSWAAAAAAALAGAGYLALWSSPDLQVIETAPGERRTLALADGSRIVLNGGTRLRIDPEAPRFARLETGEALFEISHQPDRPFRLAAGGAEVRVIGTIFNVLVEGDVFEVAVAEGAVAVDGDRHAVRLDAGMALRHEGRRVEVGARPPEAVGAWREARLAYSDAPLSRVAADLARNLGVPVEAAAEVRDRRFSGILMLDDEEQSMRRAAALLGVEARRAGAGWLLVEQGRAAP
jgi:transmembrane sensor